jgi:N-acetylglucosaminyl-diphospho-decaprenol L-rhamnosyltransferase
MQKLDVLAIIVNYKSAALTVRAVESLAAERARSPQLAIKAVVVENASGDEAALKRDLEGKYDWLTLIISPVNGGYGAGNNLAMRWAYETGQAPRYFHILNPDTECRPGAVAELVRFFDEHPRAGIGGSRFENPDGSDWATAFRFPSVWSEIAEGTSLGVINRLLDKHIVRREMSDVAEQVDWLPGASCFLRRTMIEEVGGFDEAFFLYFEETDLALRAQRAGWQTWYVPQSRVMHIAGASTGVTSQTGKPKPMPLYWFESRRRFFSKNYGLGYATLTDLAFVAGNAVGSLKRALKRQDGGRPRLLRDFVKQGLGYHLKDRSVSPARGTTIATPTK